MRNIIQKYSIAAALSAIVLVAACDDDEKNNVVPVTMEFSIGSFITSESAVEKTISIPFSGPAMANGTFEITPSSENAVYGKDYVTVPAARDGKITVSVVKGQTAAQFKVVPVDNEIMNDVKTFTLTLANPSSAFVVGTQSAVSITMTDNEGPTQINFETDVTPLFENASEESEINLVLTSPATGTGTTVVSLTSNGTYGTHFTTLPAAVDGKITLISEIGDEMETITFQTIDNDDVNGNIEVAFTIETAEGGVEKGVDLTTHTITITDDETPSTATFAVTSKSLAERKTDGFSVLVEMSPTLSKAGTLEITFASATAVYGTHYTTLPAAVGGKVTLDIAQGASETSFTVLPVNNDAVNADHVITFTMTGSTGVVVIGDTGDEFTLTAYDDDEITTIADLRAMYSGSDVTLPTGTVISGVVISKNDNVSSKDVHIQDATAGLQVSFAADNSFVVTDELKIDLTGMTLGKSTGMLLAGKDNGVVNADAIKLGTAALPAYQTLTVTEFNSNLDAYESELVQIENIGFPNADGSAKMSGSVIASNGTDQFVVRTETFATWKDNVAPYGLGTVRGVAAENTGVSQLLPQVFADDITLDVQSRLITMTQSVANFNFIKKGSQSAVQQFTVNGANLVADLVLTSPSYFLISKDNITFANSLTFAPGDVVTDQTIYIKFAPNALADGDLSSTLYVQSLGAAAKSFSVSGRQGLILDENFSYTVGSTLVSNGWVQSQTTTTNPVSVIAGGLNFTGYPTSGGAGVALVTSGQDVYKAFPASVSSGDVYLSFLVNATAAQTGDYFIGLSPGNSQTSYYDRIFIKSSGSGYVFGLSKTGTTNGTPSTTFYGATEYAFNTTYLVVVKYSFVAGDANDKISVFVFPDGAAPGTEPGTGEFYQSVDISADATSLGFVTLRQGAAASSATLTVDGVRIATLWTDLFN